MHLFRFLSRKLPSYVVTNSQSTLDRLFLTGARPAAVVPSGITDGPRLRCEREAVIHDGLGRENFTRNGRPGNVGAWRPPARVGIVGRIAPWKGQHIFLEAAAVVLGAAHRQTDCDARFVIVGAPLFGEEAYDKELRRRAESLGIGSRVEFLGFQRDVPAVLQNLDILVHASVTPEPFGQVVIEGMAEGLPVIGTDGGGVREIITHGQNGLLVPMGDATALARELLGLLRDPARARRLGSAGYAHVWQNFTAAQSARKIERVYDEALAARRDTAVSAGVSAR